MACEVTINSPAVRSKVDDVFYDLMDENEKLEDVGVITEKIKEAIKLLDSDFCKGKADSVSLKNSRLALLQIIEDTLNEYPWYSNYMEIPRDVISELTNPSNSKTIKGTKPALDLESGNNDWDFLYDIFKDAYIVQQKTINNFNLSLARSLVFDPNTHTITNSVREFNEGIKRNQLKLFETVLTYILSELNKADEAKKDLDLIKIIEEARMYDDKFVYLGGFEKILDIAKNYIGIDKITAYALQQYSKSDRQEDKMKLKAYLAFATLSNYDRFIQQYKGIGIKGDLGTFTTEDKYVLKSVAHNGSNFNEKELDIQDVVDDIVRLVVTTSPYYRFTTKTPINDKFLTINHDSNVKKLIWDLAITRGIKDTSIVDMGLSDEQLNFLFGENIHNYQELVYGFQNNPLIYGKILFDALCNDNGIMAKNKTAKIFKDLEAANSTYSIYRAIFADEAADGTGSLRSVVNSKAGLSLNYYQYYLNSILFTSPKYYKEIIEDADGIKMVSMNDKRMDQSVRDLTRSVNSYLGNGSYRNYEDLYTNYKCNLADKLFRIKIGNTLVTIDLGKTSSEFNVKLDTSEEGMKLNLLFISLIFDINMLDPIRREAWFNYRSDITRDEAISTLLLAASNIYLNAYFTHDILNKEHSNKDEKILRNKVNIQNALNSFYGRGTKLVPGLDKKSSDIGLIGPSTLNTFSDFAKAMDTVDGTSIRSTLETNEGTTVSKYAITSLFDLVGPRLLNNIRKASLRNNPYKFLSILNKSGFFDEIMLEKNASIGGVVKPRESWSLAEDFSHDFLYGYLGSLKDSGSNDIFFYLADISDKKQFPGVGTSKQVRFSFNSTDGKYYIDLNSYINSLTLHTYGELTANKKLYAKELKAIPSKVKSNFNADSKVYFDKEGKYVLDPSRNLKEFTYLEIIDKGDLGIQMLKDIYSTEIGGLYKEIINNVAADYYKLNTFILTHNDTVNELVKDLYSKDADMTMPLLFDIYDNFREFQQRFGDNSEKAFERITSAFNINVEEHPEQNYKHINFRERVHYQLVGKEFRANRLLMSLAAKYGEVDENLNRFFINSKTNFTSAEETWKTRELELVDDLLRNGVEIDLSNEDSLPIKYLRQKQNWVLDDKLVICKIQDLLGNYKNITNLKDLVVLGNDGYYTYITDSNGLNYLLEGFDMSKITNPIILNPDILAFNLIDTLTTQLFMLSSVGSPIFHDTKGKAWDNTDLIEEGYAINALNKRNVIITGTLKRFLQGSLNGIIENYKTAIVKDIKVDAYTLAEPEGNCKPFDGGTFVEPTTNYHENYSLGGSAAGMVKKPIGDSICPENGCDMFLKTASFPITNSSMLKSETDRNMMRKMTDLPWRDEQGNIIHLDITRGINEFMQEIPVTSYMNSYTINLGKSGLYIRVGDLVYTIKSLNKIDPENDIYERVLTNVVDEDSIITEQLHIASNYELWEALGGMNSVNKLDNGTWNTSEESIKVEADIMNKVNIRRKDPIKSYLPEEELYYDIVSGSTATLRELYQPLKHSVINYIITAGALKNGAANVNSAEAYYDNKPLQWAYFNTSHLGILLDPEHNSDLAEVSLMTLVMSAITSGGYTREYADSAYRALLGLTVNEIKDVLQELREKGETTLSNNISDKLAVSIAESILGDLKSGDSRSDAIDHIVRDLLNKLNNNKSLTINDIATNLPYSDPSIYNFLMSTVSSAINRTSIKLKFSGGLNVLNPSETRIKLYNGKMRSLFRSVIDFENELRKLDANPITDRTLLQLGHTYDINGELVFMKNPDVLWKYFDSEYFKSGNIREVIYKETPVNTIELGKTYRYTENGLEKEKTINTHYELTHVYKDDLGFLEKLNNNLISNIREITTYGAELGASDTIFSGTNKEVINGVETEVNKVYNLWCLDSVKRKYSLTKVLTKTKSLRNKLTNLGANVDRLAEIILDISNVDIRELVSVNYDDTILGQLNRLNSLEIYAKNELQKTNKQLYFDRLNLSSISFTPQEISNHAITDIKTVRIDGKDVVINKNSILNKLFELVVPMNFKSTYNLEYNDDLTDIVSNKNFFFKKLLKSMQSLAYAYDFDFQLANVNRNNVYLIDSTEMDPNSHKSLRKANISINKVKDSYFWVDQDGNVILKLANLYDKIYTDRKGNNIIITNDIKSYIDAKRYTAINISPEFIKLLNKKYSKDSKDPTLINKYVNDKYFKNSKYSLKKIFADKLDSQIKELLDLLLNGKELDINKMTDPIRNIYFKGLQIHTSFLKSLEVVAARIPSQCQQSFMGMKVVGFTGEENNNAYVSKWQIFLQGSDYDVDKVTLLTSSFGNNGVYTKWSPYFRYDDIDILHKSEELAFPTLKKALVITSKDIDELELGKKKENKDLKQNFKDILNKYSDISTELVGSFAKEGQSYFLKALDFKLPKELIIIEIDKLSKLLNRINEFNLELSILFSKDNNLDKFAEYTLIPTTKNQLLDELNLKMLDAHNLYLKNNFILDALKNHLVSRTLMVTKDAANIEESQTSVDTVALPLRDVADRSLLGGKDARMGIGNYMSKVIAKLINMEGKDSIAITASLGLKTYYDLANYYDYTLEKNPERALSLLFYNTFLDGGLRRSSESLEEYRERVEPKLLANSWINNPIKYMPGENSPDIEKLLWRALVHTQNDMNNVALTLSGVMTLAADNAKELKLGKLNAGANTLGMYLYGVARGMKFQNIADILTSDTARIFRRFGLSNIFSKQGGMSISTVLSIIDTPRLAPVTIEKLGLNTGRGGNVNKNSFADAKLSIYLWYLKNGTVDVNGNDLYAPTPRGFNLKSLDKIETNRTTFTKSVMKKDIRMLAEWIDALKVLIRDKINIAKKLNLLTTLTEEEAGSIYTVNNVVSKIRDINGLDAKGNPKDPEHFEPTTLDKYRELYLGALEIRRLSTMLGLNLGLKVLVTDKFKLLNLFRNLIIDAKKDKGINTTNEDYLDLQRFVSDSTYRNKAILKYDKAKHTFNILEALWTVPQYQGYLKALSVDITKSKQSAVFRATYDNYFDLVDFYKFTSKKDLEDFTKKLSRYMLAKLINKWLLTLPLFMLPKQAVVYSNYLRESTLASPGYIKLGTETGNAAFINWMNSEVIPNIKKGNYGVGTKNTISASDAFLNALITSRNTFNLASIESTTYTLKGDLSGTSEESLDLISRYYIDFNKIKDNVYHVSKTKGYSLLDLFTYYNFIVYKNGSSLDSFTKVLKGNFKTDPEIFKSYVKFVSNVDKNGNLFNEGESYILEMKLAVAPEKTVALITSSKNFPIIKVWNLDALKYIWYIKVKPEKKELDEEGNYLEQEYGEEEVLLDENGEMEESPAENKFTHYLVYGVSSANDNKYTIDSLPNHTEMKSYEKINIISKGFYNDGLYDIKLEPESTIINTLTYKGVTLNKETISKEMEKLNGTKSELNIPFKEYIVDNEKILVVDTEKLDKYMEAMESFKSCGK